jgi:hypothetical protein
MLDIGYLIREDKKIELVFRNMPDGEGFLLWIEDAVELRRIGSRLIHAADEIDAEVKGFKPS